LNQKPILSMIFEIIEIIRLAKNLTIIYDESMSKAATRTESVYRALRAAILEGRLLPGEQLPFATLGEVYGASVGVLREALARLTAEGLVVNRAQQGFRVISLSLDDLADLTETRCLIEGLLLRDAIAQGDLTWEADLVAAHHRLERTPQQEPGNPAPVTPAWAEAHRAFHMSLLAAAKRRRLKEMAAKLHDAAEIYRRWSMPFEATARPVADEHRSLLDAALDRDAERAAEVLEAHLKLTQALILRGVDEGAIDPQRVEKER